MAADWSVRSHDPNGEPVELRLEDKPGRRAYEDYPPPVAVLVMAPRDTDVRHTAFLASWDLGTTAFELDEEQALALGHELVMRATISRARREMLK